MEKIFCKQPPVANEGNHNRHQHSGSEPKQITPKIHKKVNFSKCRNALLIVPDLHPGLSCSAMEEIQTYGPREVHAIYEVTPEIKKEVMGGKFSICLRLDDKTGIITLHSELENIRMQGERATRHAEKIELVA